MCLVYKFFFYFFNLSCFLQCYSFPLFFFVSTCLPLSSSFVWSLLDSVIQNYPVTFLTEPRSQTLAVGQKLSLTCHANVTALNGIDYYTMPAIDWRFEGDILVDGEQWNISTNTDIGYSSLQVQSVGYDQAGDYECLVNDAEGHFITVSRKATLRVIETGKCACAHTHIHTSN